MGRSPSYGFSSSRNSRFPMLKERAPGPGAYAHRELGKDGGLNAGVSFTSSPRARERTRPESPDPGVYQPTDPGVTSRMTRSPRANFDSRCSTGRLVEKAPGSPRKDAAPGPGAYAHKELIGVDSGASGVAFVRSPQRKQLKPRTDTPDPGAYAPVDPSVTSKMSRQTAFGFGDLGTGRAPGENGLSKRDAVDDEGGARSSPRGGGASGGQRALAKRDVPGPGSYETAGSQPSTAPGSPRWGFGSVEARPSLVQTSRAALQSTAPGPGTYAQQPNMGLGPKFSIRGRTEGRQQSTPGPGAYGGHYTQFV